jgi:ArsR family transcriptional regulator
VLPSVADLDIRPLSSLFRALGDETRLRIVALLAHGELCVCHLERALELQQPNASRQLAILRHAGLVEARREGTWVYYRLVAQHSKLLQRSLDVLVDEYGTERALRHDLVRLRKSCGPDACK